MNPASIEEVQRLSKENKFSLVLKLPMISQSAIRFKDSVYLSRLSPTKRRPTDGWLFLGYWTAMQFCFHACCLSRNAETTAVGNELPALQLLPEAFSVVCER